MPRGLSEDVMLSVTLDAICSRNRYTTDPEAVVAELRAAAGDRIDILQESVGIWVGYFDSSPIRTLASALRQIPGLEEWISVGEERRARPDHRTPAARFGSPWPPPQPEA